MFKKIVFALFMCCFALPAKAEEPLNPAYKKTFAMWGFDPVSYFMGTRPERGSADIEYEYRGAKWRFSSNENKNTFQQDPEKYIPAYGGFCAHSMSTGYTQNSNPAAWYMHQGKLYLFISRKAMDIWKNDITGNINKAERFWALYKGETPPPLAAVSAAPAQPAETTAMAGQPTTEASPANTANMPAAPETANTDSPSGIAASPATMTDEPATETPAPEPATPPVSLPETTSPATGNHLNEPAPASEE